MVDGQVLPDGRLFFYKNVGTRNQPRYAKEQEMLLDDGTPPMATSIAVAVDWDGDGRQELVAFDFENRLCVFALKNDPREDPYEIHNLAGDAACAQELVRLRAALDDWRREVGDLGEVAEAEMVRRWCPAGEQPETAPVVFVPVCAESPGVEAAPGGGTFEGPLLVQLHCATQGASIAYTLEGGEAARWRLYAGPLRLPRGGTRVRARACRIGYKDGPAASAEFVVEPPGPAAGGPPRT